MEIVIKLLEEAIKLYRNHEDAAGDKALTVAVRVRRELTKAEKQISPESPKKP